MKIYVARQPIFDRKMNVFGYELLYRESTDNYCSSLDDTQATSELINNAFINMQFDELTLGCRAFINFSGELIEKKIPLTLPREKVVIEILERVDITEKVVEACRHLKQQGYLLALDDFIFDKDYSCLIELADIIKIEFNQVSIDLQVKIMQELSGQAKFLAEKVETREEYRLARDIGYDYFQGYFFSRPILVKGNERKVLK